MTDRSPLPPAALFDVDRSGVMRAVWWSRCPACSELIHGGLVCFCGQSHPGDLQGMASVGGYRVWVCRTCYLALAGETPP